MARKCPECGDTTSRQIARSECSPVAPQFAGGIVLALVFALSRNANSVVIAAAQVFTRTYCMRFNTGFVSLFCDAVAAAACLLL